MEFCEASDIARQNLGAVLTRDSTGTFIVRFNDGRVIGSTTESVVDSRCLDDLARERDEVAEMLNKTRAEFERREKELQAEILRLKAQISKVSETEWARIAQEEQLIREKERNEFLARDEAAKRIARSMAGPSISANSFVVYSSTDGQD